MSLHTWLNSHAPSPVKRKADNSDIENTHPKKFSKVMSQNCYDWYIQDNSNIWHCAPCREAKFSNKYAVGHTKPQKTTNHARHTKCKLFFFFFLLLRISKSYKEIEEESLIHVYSLHYYIDITTYYQIYDFFS
jgi:hypothetical protein